MDDMIKTIEPWPAAKVEQELIFRTQTLQKSLLRDLLALRLLGRAGIVLTFLMLLANLLLRLFYPLEEVLFVAGVLPNLEAIFTSPGMFLFFSCFLMTVFHFIATKAGLEGVWAGSYFESVEEAYNFILRRLEKYEEDHPEFSEEEGNQEADRLENQVYERIAQRHALENNFARAVMLEFPPPTLADRAREDYLPISDVTGLWARFWRTMTFLMMCWLVAGQARDLGLLAALLGSFLAG